MSNLKQRPTFKGFSIVMVILLIGTILSPTGSATVFAQGPTPPTNQNDPTTLPKSLFNLPLMGNGNAKNTLPNQNITTAGASITNGDFEQGQFVGWSEFSSHGYPLVLSAGNLIAPPHSGSWAAWLGGDDLETSVISQGNLSFGTPTTLRLWYWIASEDVCGFDFGFVTINFSNTIHFWDLCNMTNTGGWAMLDLNLDAYIGQTITLSIGVETDDSLNSNLFIDDVSLIVTPPTISGNAGVAGTTLNYTGGSTTADGSGNYSFSVPVGWSGTVIPSKTCYSFSPANRPYSNVMSNQTGQNYTPTLLTHSISGNTGVAGVTLSYVNGGVQTTTSDGSGNYSITVPCGWSGMVIPYKSGYAFTPLSRSYSSLLSNQTGQTYTAQACASCADVSASMGVSPLGSYTLDNGQAITPYYDGLAGGPVLVESTNAINILTSEHRNYQTSFSVFGHGLGAV